MVNSYLMMLLFYKENACLISTISANKKNKFSIPENQTFYLSKMVSYQKIL